ncbi:MAG: hypothetical protein ABJF23_01575 [Bryobacteraceae bacterium]
MKPLSAATIAFAALVGAYLNQLPVEVAVVDLPPQYPDDSLDAASPRSTCHGYTRSSR